jgi:hypothetical protein
LIVKSGLLLAVHHSKISKKTQIVSTLHQRFGYGYPTPFLGRDELVDTVLSALEKEHIFSRGRFGAWKYEVSNQDHTYMQGVELARWLLFNEAEITYSQPELVNSGTKQLLAST